MTGSKIIAKIFEYVAARIRIMTNIITIAIACFEKFIRVDPHRGVRDPVQTPLLASNHFPSALSNVSNCSS